MSYPSEMSVTASRPTIVKTGTENPDPVTGLEFPIPKCLNRLRAVAEVVVTEDESEETILKAVQGATVLMTTYGDVTRRVIEAGLPTLKGIVELGTGMDSLDIDAAKELGVRVVNCPRYARNAVAECAFLLLITCMKKFAPIHRAVHAQGWVAALEPLKSMELEGKIVGMVGFGHINSTLARMCQGFDMKVQAYDPYLPRAAMEQRRVSKVNDLDELMACSDVVAVCLPLNAETTGIISEHRLRKMKPSAFLINVGRGACVDEMALLALLREGAIAGCGLDVFTEEPLRKQGHALSELIDMDNVIITPHLAAWTCETWERLQAEVVQHVMDILEGRDSVIYSSDPRLRGQAGCVYPEERTSEQP
ncbi:MAG: C-terminal binding protein [Proteobacteria bacterium]|nr:MAG: C-terminal binding protein [Pseudomonadota bacterium]